MDGSVDNSVEERSAPPISGGAEIRLGFEYLRVGVKTLVQMTTGAKKNAALILSERRQLETAVFVT